MTKVVPLSPSPLTERQERLERTGDLLRLLGRKVLPLATIAFVLIYWAVASVAYFTPSLQFNGAWIFDIFNTPALCKWVQMLLCFNTFIKFTKESMCTSHVPYDSYTIGTSNGKAFNMISRQKHKPSWKRTKNSIWSVYIQLSERSLVKATVAKAISARATFREAPVSSFPNCKEYFCKQQRNISKLQGTIKGFVS